MLMTSNFYAVSLVLIFVFRDQESQAKPICFRPTAKNWTAENRRQWYAAMVMEWFRFRCIVIKVDVGVRNVVVTTPVGDNLPVSVNLVGLAFVSLRRVKIDQNLAVPGGP